MKKTKSVSSAVDRYIRSFPGPVQKMLKALRAAIRRIVPAAEERMSYRMPAFFLKRNLVYYAAFSRHIGLYPGANAVAEFAGELSKFKYAKGSIQFPLDRPLPLGLVTRMVRWKAKTAR